MKRKWNGEWRKYQWNIIMHRNRNEESMAWRKLGYRKCGGNGERSESGIMLAGEMKTENKCGVMARKIIGKRKKMKMIMAIWRSVKKKNNGGENRNENKRSEKKIGTEESWRRENRKRQSTKQRRKPMKKCRRSKWNVINHEIIWRKCRQ